MEIVMKGEIFNWLNRLETMQLENVLLKNTLANLIQFDISPQVLDQLEYFQNSFLNKDAVFALLRYDIAGIYRQEAAVDTRHDASPDQRHIRLGMDLDKMELEFCKLKEDFSNYVLQSQFS